jgi:hypothetical protein
MSYSFGYTPYWNLTVNELLNKAHTLVHAEKPLQNELARRLDVIIYELEEARAQLITVEDEMRELRSTGVPSNCSHCGEAFVDD